jgi:site-specific DNA-cytosine methylase
MNKQRKGKKIILDLCGGTGAWSRPYKEAGYDVRVITWPDWDVKNHIFYRDEVLDFWSVTKKLEMEVKVEDVYGILAAPPCTMFSLARTRAKKPRNFAEGMEVVKACLDIIWEVREKQKLAFWALENPMGYLRQFLGKPPFTFNPTDFGERYTKKTDIWGYFNFPVKKPITLTEGEKKLMSTNSRHLPSISDITGSKQADRRAITPRGFAEAFFKANQ